MAELTDEQRAVYDRQLRVWGLETQSKLSAARVLVVGCTGVTAEVCKNLVLAGVGALSLVDDTPCDQAPPGCFLVPHDAAATTRVAAACAATLSEMNPFVKVAALPLERRAVDAAHLQGSFDVLIAGRCPFPELVALNTACRAAGVKLFAAAVCQSHGHFFADLGPSHTMYPPPKKVAHDDAGGDQPGEPAAAAPPKTLVYAPIAAAMAAPLETLPKTLNGAYLLLRAACAVEQSTGKRLEQGDAAALRRAGAELRPCPAASAAQALSDASLDAYAAGCGVEMPAISAVVGGVLANDVLKAISCVGEPALNFVFFDAASLVGTLDRVACPE